ncbi:probable L-type lectin-domain containing receptor kinase S.7 [Triticum aestivum]|uniref:probable L-type lectin-domain containing receptor kinase S.7 n=1 Tax=Triticum aestivum TaxID=4565 RepID=UPI001D029C63|nr:probable L-type lectin-domain containing receptor kinase S.7 [Triticum aestivum]
MALPAIPDELLVEILLRLPTAADLIRASAVCVSFRRLVADRSFLRHRFKFAVPPHPPRWRQRRRLLLRLSPRPCAGLVHTGNKHLFHERQQHRGHQQPVLPWERRYDIVKDVAAGLHYVHHEYERTVLHRDIKASNIMLDSAFRGRLGDFGLARVVGFDKNSFTDVGFPLLVDWAWWLHQEGRLLEAVDAELRASEAGFDADDAARLLLLGLSCSNPNPSDRPTLANVLQVVAKTAPLPDVPLVKPAFVWPPEGALLDDDVDDGFAGTSRDDYRYWEEEETMPSFMSSEITKRRARNVDQHKDAGEIESYV